MKKSVVTRAAKDEWNAQVRARCEAKRAKKSKKGKITIKHPHVSSGAEHPRVDHHRDAHPRVDHHRDDQSSTLSNNSRGLARTASTTTGSPPAAVRDDAPSASPPASAALPVARQRQPSSPSPRIVSKRRRHNVTHHSSTGPVSNDRSDTADIPSARFSVWITKPLGFDANQYRRLPEIALAPSTYPDSTLQSTPQDQTRAPTLKEIAQKSPQSSIVIPDSQGFDDTLDFSTFILSQASPTKNYQGRIFLDEALGASDLDSESRVHSPKVSPPPSYEESQSQATSSWFLVQISDPVTNQKSEAVGRLEQQPLASSYEPITSESFNLDLSQASNLASEHSTQKSLPKTGRHQKVLVDIKIEDQETKETDCTQSSCERPTRQIQSSGNSIDTQPDDEALSERLVFRGRTRRRRGSNPGDQVENWFQTKKPPARAVLYEPSTSRDITPPLDTISAYSETFPFPPSLSAMSSASPARALSLKEKMEANRRHMEEQLALEQMKRHSSATRSSPSLSSPARSREFITPIRVPFHSSLYDTQQNAQIRDLPIPSPVQQSFTISEPSTQPYVPKPLNENDSSGYSPRPGQGPSLNYSGNPGQTPSTGISLNLGISPNSGILPNSGISPSAGKVHSPKIAHTANSGLSPNLGMARNSDIEMVSSPKIGHSSVIVSGSNQVPTSTVARSPVQDSSSSIGLGITQSSGYVLNSQIQSQFGPPVVGEEEYAIGLPLSTSTVPSDGLNQKAIYLHEIYQKQADIDEYLSKKDKADSRVKRSAFDLVRTLGQIATHPNLAYPVNSALSDEKEAEFQVVLSAKFRFLHELFEVIKEENIKIAIVAEADLIVCIQSSIEFFTAEYCFV